MNTTMKSAIALGAVSFAVTMWALKSGHGVSRSDPAREPSAVRSEAEPAAHDARRDLPSDFASAMRAAAQVGSTPEGLKYQDEAAPALSSALQDKLSSCLLGSSPLGQAAFTIVVGVAPDGALRSVWASPETPLASCVLHRLARAALPPPPIPDFWIAANITPDAAAPEPAGESR